MISEQQNMHRQFSGKCRLVVSDVDFTYLDDAKQVPAENLSAIAEARAREIHFAFASGRAWAAVRPLAMQLGLRVPQIVNNGAELIDPLTDECVEACRMSPELSRFLYEAFMKRGFYPLLFKNNRGLAEDGEAAVLAVLAHNNEPVEIVSAQYIQEVLSTGIDKFAAGSIARVEELARVDAEIATEAEKRGWRYSHAFTEPGILVISDGGATKVKGIEKLCKRLGCSLNDVMALGDGDNDAEMLGAVGLGVAMANATPKAKEAACYTTTADCNHAGVAEAIRRFC